MGSYGLRSRTPRVVTHNSFGTAELCGPPRAGGARRKRSDAAGPSGAVTQLQDVITVLCQHFVPPLSSLI